MTTNIVKTSYGIQGKQQYLPSTGRGRALYTIDWFLNGKPVLRNHDNPQLTIRNGCHC